MSDKKIRIQKYKFKWQGCKKRVELRMYLIDEHGKICASEYVDYFIHDEAEGDHLKHLFKIKSFKNREFKQITPQIIEAVCKMSKEDKEFQTAEITVGLKSHFSCKTNKNVNPQATGEAGVCQSELKNKLATHSTDSKTMKSFEDNKCSVCLSNYKEILDEDLHIVVPSCGHPLCCKCADNILVSEKKECPSCRENFTTQSFDLMKFNEDLTVNFEDKRLFL